MSDKRTKTVPRGWGAALASWCDVLRAAGRRPGTVYIRRAHIAQLARWAGGSPETLTRAQLVAYLAGRSWSSETRRAVSSSLRSFLLAAGRGDLVGAVPSVRPSPPAPRPIPDLLLTAALARCRDRRVWLAMRLAGEAGLRRAEIAGVHSRHVLRDLVGFSLDVQGKGGRRRVVPVPEDVAQLVLAADGFVFAGRDGHPMSPGWLGKLAGRWLPDGWTLHTLRHRFATRAHEATGDLLAVQRLLGHSSPETTQRYVDQDAARLRAVAAAARIAA